MIRPLRLRVLHARATVLLQVIVGYLAASGTLCHHDLDKLAAAVLD